MNRGPRLWHEVVAPYVEALATADDRLMAYAELAGAVGAAISTRDLRWYEDPGELADFLQWMEKTRRLASGDELGHVLLILRDPIRWEGEHYRFTREKEIAKQKELDGQEKA